MRLNESLITLNLCFDSRFIQSLGILEAEAGVSASGSRNSGAPLVHVYSVPLRTTEIFIPPHSKSFKFLTYKIASVASPCLQNSAFKVTGGPKGFSLEPKHPVIDIINNTGKLDEETEKKLAVLIEEFKKKNDK